MKFGFISNNDANVYLPFALHEHGHEGIGCLPTSHQGFSEFQVKDLLERDLDFVIIDQLGKHTASFSLELEDRGIKMFNGGSVQAYTVQDPNYLKTLGHRIGLPIGGEVHRPTRLNICVLASRKGVCGPAFLTESWDRLGPVRCPQNVLCSAVPILENTRIYEEICRKVGKIFSSFGCSGVACIEVDVKGTEINITNLSLTPPEGFWALWLEFYAGEDPANVFHGLAKGAQFTYPVHSDKLGIAALLTVPPFPITFMDVDHSTRAAFINRPYKDLGKMYRVGLQPPKEEEGHEYHLGVNETLGWKVVLEDEVDALTILKQEAERLDDQFIQTPTEFPGFDMAYVRGLLEKNNWIEEVSKV